MPNLLLQVPLPRSCFNDVKVCHFIHDYLKLVLTLSLHIVCESYYSEQGCMQVKSVSYSTHPELIDENRQKEYYLSLAAACALLNW